MSVIESPELLISEEGKFVPIADSRPSTQLAGKGTPAPTAGKGTMREAGRVEKMEKEADAEGAVVRGEQPSRLCRHGAGAKIGLAVPSEDTVPASSLGSDDAGTVCDTLGTCPVPYGKVSVKVKKEGQSEGSAQDGNGATTVVASADDVLVRVKDEEQKEPQEELMEVDIEAVDTGDSKVGVEEHVLHDGAVPLREGRCKGEQEEAMELEEKQAHMQEEEEEYEQGLRGSIARMKRYIERGTANALAQQLLDQHSTPAALRKRHVIVVGLTGSGKSTLVNSLAGCKLRLVTEAEAEAQDLPLDAVCVVGNREGGRREEVSKIGNTFGKSQTKVLQAVAVEEEEGGAGLVVWDAPGFEDSSGPEQNIANAVNLQRLFKASSLSHCGGVVVLVVLDAPSLDSGRGSMVKNTLDILSQLFGGRDVLEAKLASLVFCITKATSRASLKILQNWIVRLSAMEGVCLEGCRERIVLFDPLREDLADKLALTALLRGVAPVGVEKAFHTSLNAEDEALLCAIADECAADISACMRAADMQGALDHWKLLEAFDVIQHAAVLRATHRVHKCVMEVVDAWRAEVRSLHSDQSAEGRKKVQRRIGLLKASCAFVGAGAGKRGSGGHVAEEEVEEKLGAMESEHRALLEEVALEEAKHQEQHNTQLELEFSKLQQAFTVALTTRADLELQNRANDREGAARGGGGGRKGNTGATDSGAAVAVNSTNTRSGWKGGGGGGGGGDSLFAPVVRFAQGVFGRAFDGKSSGGSIPGHCLWSFAEELERGEPRPLLEQIGFVHECEEGRRVLEWFTQVKKLAKARKNQCVHGDQRSLLSLLDLKRQQVLEVCRQVVCESKMNYDIRECVHALLQHADAAVEAKCSELSSARLRASDIAKLRNLGFAKAAKHVNLLQSLLAQAAGLRAGGRKGRIGGLQATAQAEQVVDELMFQVFERASKQQKVWTLRCQDLAGKIDKMLHEEQYERDVKALTAALNDLKGHVGSAAAHMYTDKVRDIRTKVEKLQSEGELLTLIEARNFNEIVKRYRTLKQLRRELAAHLHLDETPLRDFTIRNLEMLKKAAESEIRADPTHASYLECTSLRALRAIWPTLRTAFPDTVDNVEAQIKKLAFAEINQTVVRVKQEVIAMGKEMMTKDAQQRIARMLVKGHAIATELQGLPAFQKEIQKVLDKGLNDEGRYIIGISLESMAAGSNGEGEAGGGGDQAAEIARAIIDSFPAFKNFNVKIFNAKAAGVSFEQALAWLRCVPARKKISAAYPDTLQLAFGQYSTTYSAEVNQLVKSLQTYPIDRTKQRIAELAAQLRPQATRLAQHPQHFGELLGLVCAAWTFLSCSEGGRYSGAEKSSVQQPHATQILGILRLLALDQGSLSNHLIQINTGEGKSIALGFTAVILAALGFAVDVVCYSRYLCERDCKAFAALFQLLEQDAHISYNDFNALSSKIMHNGVHLPEVRATFRRFLQGDAFKSKKRARDAADNNDDDGDGAMKCLGVISMAYDMTRDVTTSTKRGCAKDKGKEVKEEEGHEEKQQEMPSTRADKRRKTARGQGRKGGEGGNGGRDRSKSPPRDDDGGGGGASFGAQEPAASSKGAKCAGAVVMSKGDSAVKKETGTLGMERRPSVLLLDEVDVFFGDGFYGKPYRPCIDLDDDAGFDLLFYLWHSRDMFPRTEDSMQKLMARKEVASLRKTFPNLSAPMLQRELNKMLDAALRFPKGGAPKLRGGEKDYTIQAKQQRICYIDPASGVPCDSITYGYVTAFTYLHCEEHGRLNMDAVRAHVKLQPICGTLSYSQIPRFYTFCLGMTGTLDCLTKEQDELLTLYNFRQRTFLPSTFHKKALNAQQDAKHARTVVVHGSYDEYFEAILDDITRELTKGRAILLVFADGVKLSRFSAAIHKTSPNLPQYTPPLELSDQLSNDVRASVVMQAIRRYKITLMTRSYGRGTDFVCRDQGLVKNGGVHIIVTFLPEDESEDKQLMGRTCRQDDPGSGRKILFAEDLEYLDASENKFMASGLKDWDAFLLQRRNEHEALKYSRMQANHAESMAKHKQTVLACETVKRGQWKSASSLFYEAAEELQSMKNAGGTQHYHVVFALDESGSMTGQPWHDLVEAVRSFLQLRQDAGAEDMVSLILFNDKARCACAVIPLADCLARIGVFLQMRGGGTAFGPALSLAHQVMAASLQQSAYLPLIMFMSDGGSSDGEPEMRAIHGALSGAGLQVKTLGFGSSCDSGKLGRLADLGGGEFLHALTGLELKQCFEQAAASLAHSF